MLAKVIIAGFMGLLADIRKPIFWHQQVMGEPLKWNLWNAIILCHEKQTVFIIIYLEAPILVILVSGRLE